MSVAVAEPKTDHARIAAELVAEARAHDGMIPVDTERFWVENDAALKDPFSPTIAQVPMGLYMGDECVFEELGVAEDFWRLETDAVWTAGLKRAYNDKAERIVGRRLMNDTVPDPKLKYPAVKELHDIFEARNEWHAGSWWLQKSANNEDELKALLDRVEARDVRSFILPPNWAEEKERLTKLGIKPRLYRDQRGPVTFATSIYGLEDLLFLIMDNEPLAMRFRDAILKTMLELGRVLDEEAGYTPETAPRGFGFRDDNCYLLTPPMYELFGFPVLKGMFARYAPGAKDWRYQHSDSAMGHLLPLLGRLDMLGLNLGPTLSVTQIRQHCPHAAIHGQLAPFTFSRNEEEKIVAEFLRDYEQAREKRGLVFTTAGSVNNGSRLTGMRLIMAAIQRYGRYA
jgi:uroporphyrinogen decarboxylase